MALDSAEFVGTKRRLILRDALIFLSLTCVTLVLFSVTLFLFRSFAEHRSELARRWADRGLTDLGQGKPDRAIVSLRTALSYAPGEHSYELLLAQALGDSGRVDESYNYFAGLWERTPGDGQINLRLAHLAATKGDKAQAINFYRAAIYGTWEGDGVVRRRDVRLELAHYLLQQHDPAVAREEILTAVGNAPADPPLDARFARLLRDAGDPRSALNLYQKSLAGDPSDVQTLAAAGDLAFSMGDFVTAHHLLQRALRHTAASKSTPPEQVGKIKDLLDRSDRLLDLDPAQAGSSTERVRRVLSARALARSRMDACTASSASSSTLQDLRARWSANDANPTRAALLRDPSRQTALLQLALDTEAAVTPVCGPPTGDDALLLLLSHAPQAVEP